MRHAEWYLDEDVLGLAAMLARAKLPVTWPGDDGRRDDARLIQPPSPVTARGVPDEEWIPIVAGAGLSILTRDRRIIDRTVRVNAVMSSRAQLFAITSSARLDVWTELRIVAAQWDELQRRRAEPGPFVDAVTMSGVRRLLG